MLSTPAATTVLVDRHGAFLAQLGEYTGQRVDYGFWPVEPLPGRIVQAALALEDRRFWTHPGVDAGAVLRAVWQDLRAVRRVSGASTIAMQVARNAAPGPAAVLDQAG